MTLSRRDFLKISGLTGAAVSTLGLPLSHVLSAQNAATLQWWDHFLPLQPLLEATFAQYSAANAGVTVEHTVYSPPDLGQALQLAYPATQAPDVFAIANIGLPVAALRAENWFTSLESYVDPEWKAALPQDVLIEGLTVFGGELYSFPMFSFRFHEALTWFNKQLLADAGYDPEVGVQTWDEFRDASQKITAAGGGTVFGWMQGIGHVERMAETLVSLAKAAGSPGAIDWLTGEYQYASDTFVNALEFLVSLSVDGLLSPSGITIDTRNARARWAAGEGGLFFDGPWNIGVLTGGFPDFIDSVGVSGVITPEAGTQPYIGRGPKAGDFWVSSQSQNPQHAAGILQLLTSDEFQIGLAERMDQPPLDATAVSRANVHPTYARSIELFAEQVRLAPEPLVRNPAVAEALSRMTDVRPNLGEIIQGAISGEVSDIRGTLQTYNDQMSAARESAVSAAQGAGIEVSLDDWVFPNWTPDQDYTAANYDEL